MIRTEICPRFCVLALGIALFLPTTGLADTYYTAILDGDTAGTTSTATGTATLILNAAETEISYVIEYSELDGTETVAHIHNAPPGILGPIFHVLAFGSPKVGVWPVGPFEVAELNAGRVNILIHSDMFPASELRGDMAFAFVSAVDGQGGGNLPAVLELADNFPNPFNPTTTIRFGLPREERVVLDVFDVRGRLVNSLLNETRPAGYHTVVWDGEDHQGAPVASGVYQYRVVAGDLVISKRMVLVK